MRYTSTIKCMVTRFRAGTSGNVAIIFALSAVPMLLAAGAALDFVQATNKQAQLQAAIDAGALAAAATPDLSDSERVDLANSVFASNFAAGSGSQATTNVIIADGAVSMSADLAVPTAFMRVAGLGSMDIASSVTVNIPEPKKAEIALALDYSWSMHSYAGSKRKYAAMRDAAIEMVEDLTDGAAADRVKFGLVPFSHHVQVTLPGKYVVGQDPASDWTGCTQDRMYPHNTTAATPDVDDDTTKWGQPHSDRPNAQGCGAYVPNSLVVRPISDDHGQVVEQLNEMFPYSYTHISLAFEFAWHLLTPNAPFTDVAPMSDDETMKVIVLLTDGRQTEYAFGPGGSRNPAKGEENLEALCENAKSGGIRVITVAFDLQHSATEDRLRNCATDPDKDFFIADDGAELSNTFDTIKAELKQAIYISK